MRLLRSRPWSLLLVAVVLLAACASDDGSDTSTTEPDDPTQVEAPGVDAEGDDAVAPAGTLERYVGYETISYDDPTRWVCRPDADDICDTDLDTTVIETDGTVTVEEFQPATDPPIDCFYVYPTISRDETPFSDWDASDDEEGYVTLNQAARLQSECRLFAPVYRQITLTSLLGRLGGSGDEGDGANGADDEGEQGSEDEAIDPLADVLDAFRTYMATDNGGRGFVLIGHSQGSSMLTQLIAEEVDPNDDVRALLVGAYLAGSSVAVPDGELVGGSFQHVPLCSADGEVGCATTWAAFRADEPPPGGSFFGRPRAGEGVAGCVSPASPAGGPAELDAYFPSSGASILSSLGASTDGATWLDPTVAEIATPFVRVPGLVTGECASSDGFNFLGVTVNADPDDPRADDIPGDLTPEWGLHLIDVNLVMGDIVSLVAAQADAHGG